MVGKSQQRRRLVEEVAELYNWIESQLQAHPDRAGVCNVCGACCDFVGYDHLLFVTPPELIYLARKPGVEKLKPMVAGRCPYQEEGKCTVHTHRFSGCRIFCCTGDADFQSELTEAVLKKLKTLCERFEIPYRYADLAKALETFISDTCRWAEGPCPGDRTD